MLELGYIELEMMVKLVSIMLMVDNVIGVKVLVVVIECEFGCVVVFWWLWVLLVWLMWVLLLWLIRCFV